MALNPGLLPNDGAPIAGPGGLATQEWRDFFLLLASGAESSDLADEYTALADRVSSLEGASGLDSFTMLGDKSVVVYGTPQDGSVQLALDGDVLAPGVSWYYGTGPDGVKGFYRLYDAMGAGVGIIKTDSSYVVLGIVDSSADLPGSGNVGEAYRVLEESEAGLWVWDGAAWVLDAAANGVVGFHLAELPDTGIGAALVKTTRDAYGRVEGTEAATTDDLAEGATNLYFPEAPIDGTPYARQDAAWVAAGGGGSNTRGITVTGGSIGGAVITVAQVIGGLSASDYTLTGNWYLWCSPTGSIEVDVRRAAFGSLPPGPGDTICGGNEPAVSGAISASGNFTGWSTGIARNDALSVVVNSVTDVTWFVLLLEAV